MINTILHHFNIQPQQTIKVDDCAVGIDEGKNANCKTAGIYGYSNYNDPEDAKKKLQHADHLIFDLGVLAHDKYFILQ